MLKSSVLEAALRIVDRGGLAALTMRSLGQELGVEGMAIYHYFARKDDLMDALVASLYREPPAPTGDWRADLRALSHMLRDEMRAHPAMLLEFLSRPVRTEAADAAREAQYAALSAAGLSGVGLLDAHRTWGSYVFGYLITERLSDLRPEHDWMPVSHPDRPLTNSLVGSMSARNWDEQFDIGLDQLFDGFDVGLTGAVRKEVSEA
ncbi:TetR/AcrR family transcriptional regulator [Nocardia sp. NPDC051570]|uniref:TetR/AcrR family transcriptional regulator n=1 Tax=Nocardia sp. NPDC051570 TaxID=3364324 RepID=UPI00379FCC6F